LLDGDKKVASLFEPVLEMLVADDLHRLRQQPSPLCRSVPDNCGRRKLHRRQLTANGLSGQIIDSGDVWIVV
jgi:hypothetical protein